MVAFLSFVIVALAGTVVASLGGGVDRRELKMESKKRDVDRGRITLDCQGGDNDAFFLSSVSEAKLLATVAAGWIQYVGIDNSLFVDYFGAGQKNGTIQHQRFTDTFKDYSAVLSCNDPDNKCQPGDVSWSDNTGIHFCPKFFEESDSTAICEAKTVDSLSVRGATLLSKVEQAHFGDGTYNSGSCAQARLIASHDPYTAAHNSDSYRCFALQAYAYNRCGHMPPEA